MPRTSQEPDGGEGRPRAAFREVGYHSTPMCRSSPILRVLLILFFVAPAVRGEEVKVLWERARKATAAKQWDEGARLAEAILLQGKELPAVLVLLARCRLEKGQADQARLVVERALELEPKHPAALKLREVLDRRARDGASPSPGSAASAHRGVLLPERLFGPVSPHGKKALEAYYGDDLEQAALLAEQAIAQDPGDPAGLYVQALIARDTVEKEELNTKLLFLTGRFPRATFLNSMRLGGAGSDFEESYIREVEASADPDPFALAVVSGHHRTRLEGDQSRAALVRAWSVMKDTDRETLLALAAAHLALNDPVGAAKALDLHESLFGTWSWHRYYTSELLMARGQLGQAADAGMDAFVRDPRRLVLLFWIQDTLASQGREADLTELWVLAAEAFPEREDLRNEALRSHALTQRRQALRTVQEGIWHVDMMVNVPPEMYQVVMSSLEDAYRTVGARMSSFPPRVRVRIEDQIVTMPGALAYYHPVDDTLCIGAVEYMEDSPVGKLTARVISRHEYTHYLHAYLQREKGLTQRVHISTQWLSEGLADWASDGLGLRLAVERENTMAFLRSGPVPIADLSGEAIQKSGEEGAQIDRWYLQGSFMVTSLLQREKDTPKQLERLLALSMALQRKESLEKSLKDHFGLTVDEFVKGYTDLMRVDLGRIENDGWTGGRHETIVLEPDKKGSGK